MQTQEGKIFANAVTHLDGVYPHSWILLPHAELQGPVRLDHNTVANDQWQFNFDANVDAHRIPLNLQNRSRWRTAHGVCLLLCFVARW
jgi:hypothetical protein